MDRVLIVSDEVVFSAHIEKTLTEIGLEVKTLAHEAGLLEVLTNFRPEVLIAKGDSAKVSSLRVGNLLRDRFKFPGKVIIILNKDQKINPDDLNRVKMDALLFEPIGAIKLVSHVLNLINEHKEAIRSKLIKLVENDAAFRAKEEKILVSSGQSIDQELIHVTGQVGSNPKSIANARDDVSNAEMLKIRDHIMQELASTDAGLQSKIDVYNQEISRIDAGLKNGLNRKQTKAVQISLRKEQLVDPGQEKLDSLDEERKRFAFALVKKK